MGVEVPEQMQIQGARDVRMIDRILRHPDWVMPENIHAWLPSEMAQVVQLKDKDGNYKFSETARVRAARILMLMSQQNRDSDPVPEQINVTVSSDVGAAMEALKSLPREELERLAAAADVLDRVRNGSSSAPH